LGKNSGKEKKFKGQAVSPGIAIGFVHRIETESLDLPKFWVSDREIHLEIDRFQEALKKTQKELARLGERLCQFQSGEQAQILEFHQMLAQDETLIRTTLNVIREEKINAEWAFHKTLHEILDGSPQRNDYFNERYAEIHHLARRILQHLIGSKKSSPHQFKRDSIVVAHDLSPADTLQMVKSRVQGFLTEGGGLTSHTAIIARAFEMPAVFGIEGITHMVREGDPILIDGQEGIVFLHPTKKVLNHYRELQENQEKSVERLLKEVHLPSVTLDGYRLGLAANMELIDEIPTIQSHGAEGIGLFRTEMMFLTQKVPPTEEEQYHTYRKILSKMNPKPVTIRTFDVGADKVSMEDMVDSDNPALGLRAIRYGLKKRDWLKAQLRSMLRASRYGVLKILIPMVTNIEEVQQVKKILAEIRTELRDRRIPFDPAVKLGAMVETPAAALMANELAREVDFLSIGTNDLTQYTLAVDRANEEVSYLYEPLHPAVIRLLKMICDAGKSQNIEISLCGEMAGDPACFLLLLGLGLSELSMNPLSIPRVKKLIREVTFRQARELLDRVLDCKSATEVEHMVQRENSKLDRS